MTTRRLAVTCGDPAGVGPEVISRWLSTSDTANDDIVVLGPAAWLQTLPGDMATETVGDPAYTANLGEPDVEGAKIAWHAMRAAAAGDRKSNV